MLKDEFKVLQKKWYKLLEQSGFKDVETFKGDELVLKLPAEPHLYRHLTQFECYMRQQYFLSMAHTANCELTEYRNDVDKYILIRHSDGAEIKSIIDELLCMGTPRDRTTVRMIIRRYEMSWGLINYDRRQLRLKKRNHG